MEVVSSASAPKPVAELAQAERQSGMDVLTAAEVWLLQTLTCDMLSTLEPVGSPMQFADC
jgi:hypothetical protein